MFVRVFEVFLEDGRNRMIICLAIPELGIAVERGRLPDSVGLPLALTGVDGLVAVCSAEAFADGVRPGQKPSATRAICPAVVLIPYDDAAYRTAAEPIWNLCAEESSIVEPISAELVCLVIALPDWRARALDLAAVAQDETGCTISIGIGASKAIATIAAQQARPGDVLAIPGGFEWEFLAPLSLSLAGDLDPDTLARLTRLGLSTFGDLLDLGTAKLPKALSKAGLRLMHLATGRDASKVCPSWPPPAAFARVPFEEPTEDRTLLSLAFLHAGEELAATLLARQRWCKEVLLTIEMVGRSEVEREALRLPVRDAKSLALAAERCCNRLTLSASISAVVVGVGKLSEASGRQLALFDPASVDGELPHEKEAALSSCLSRITRRSGKTPLIAHALLSPRASDRSALRLTRNLNRMVAVDALHGLPTAIRSAQTLYEVEAVTDRWREARWFRGSHEQTVYRLETNRGLLEVVGSEGAWWVRGQAD